MFLKFQKFSICFFRLILYIQILIHGKLDFPVKSTTVVVVFLVFALIIFFQQILAILDKKK